MKSIVQDKRECWFCKTTYNLHNHHIFEGPKRKLSDQDGLTVYLCMAHHTGKNGVHFSRFLDLKLKQIGEKKWLEYYHKTTDDFIKRYGKNYI